MVSASPSLSIVVLSYAGVRLVMCLREEVETMRRTRTRMMMDGAKEEAEGEHVSQTEEEEAEEEVVSYHAKFCFPFATR